MFSMNEPSPAAPTPVGVVQLLSIDFHISPIADLKDDLKDVFGKSFIETIFRETTPGTT